uniref:Uncharacterized protein n=1 Tax=Oncorhynchus kisutch TaxID=8019 RepID=A0A8C7JGZ9_ONCKI
MVLSRPNQAKMCCATLNILSSKPNKALQHILLKSVGIQKREASNHNWLRFGLGVRIILGKKTRGADAVRGGVMNMLQNA